MSSEPQAVTSDEVHELVANALLAHDEPSQLRPDGVWLTRWPSVRITVDHAQVFQSAPDSGAWTAWVDLTWMYYTDLPNTAAKAHFIGLGAGRAEALSDAVTTWATGAVPVLISYIEGHLKAGAETWPATDPRTVPGWSCICGPYVLRGDATSVAVLGDSLKQHPLLAVLRDHLATVLDHDALFQTVSLYRAQTLSGTYADVLIDNRPDAAAGELLKLAEWPHQLADSNFVSARHFLLFILSRKTSAAPDAQDGSARVSTDTPRPYRRALATGVFFLLASAFAYALHEGFFGYAEALARQAGPARFTLIPASSFFWVPSSILGILFAAAIFLVVTFRNDRFGGRGFDEVPWRLVAFAAIIAAFMGLLAYLAAHSRIQLAPDEIVLRRLWSFETERYPYSRVSALREDGKPGDRGATFSIELRDAPAWSTRQEVIYPGVAEKQYLMERTGRQVERSPAQ